MRNAKKNHRAQGFTLIELLVAMGLFALIAGGALTLFSGNLPVYVAQQNQAGLNIAIRNAMSQMQNDIVNAGSGYYTGTNIPDWPVGVTIQNNVSTTACNTPATYTYGPNCFDQINVITTDKNTPPAHLTDATLASLATDCEVTTGTSIYVLSNAGTTLAQATAQAADYLSGDELLLVTQANSALTTVHLTANGAVATVGTLHGVKLSITANTTPASPSTGTNSATADPLGITTHYNAKLGTSFCATDWIMRLTPIEYYVDTTIPTDPILTRQVVSAGADTDAQLAEQMVGLKIGADLYNTSDDCPIAYYYNAAQYPATGGTCSTGTDAYDFTRIRSVRISMIARTTPETDPTYVFRNSFDGGPYQVEGVSIVVDPRNLTMNNN